VLAVLAQVHGFVGHPFGIGQKFVAGGAAQVHCLAYYHGHALRLKHAPGDEGQRGISPGSKLLHEGKIWKYLGRAITKEN
jgi:hypothetical protein